MKLRIYQLIKSFLPVVLFVNLLASCNKELPYPVPIVQPPPAGSSITEILADPNYSILKAAVTRANLTALLSDKSKVFTFFAPDDAAMQYSGIPSAAAVNFFRPGQLDTLLKYCLIGGVKYTAANIPASFPNLYLQSNFILAPPSPSLPPGLRMPIFPAKNGSALFVNNIPITQADIPAANGVIHRVAAVIMPPSQYLWDRINADPNLTYLKAAIQRADSGVAAASTLQAALLNPAANLTVFAPTNTAFQTLLTGQITLALIAQGMDPGTASATASALAASPTVFQNPALYSVLTPLTVKGLVVYHMLGIRAFSVNMPTVATSIKTLLNSAIPAHPGVSITAVFGMGGVTAATIKGLGNATASNFLINPTPAPGGTSDQHYINGALHEIDQVLIPQ
ncbi:MAG: fasciclin domain-containing protein [Bacteroidetes bacterium]|nr:fasciclin domain-containing protein [Bacteroidota bacterium]MBS1633060.1 fasciclin domain-containing protein [Bacteroidota bacterium]